MLPERSDAELVRSFSSDPAAFELLYRRHVRSLVRYAARRCDRPADVADVVAGTFVVMLESAGAYDPSKGEVLPWLLGIARHLAADLHRHAQREREALARVAGHRTLEADELLELEDRIDAARAKPRIEAALGSLTSMDRELLWLAGHSELSARQAAQVLGLSQPAFRMRLMRARRALRRSLADDGERPARPRTARIPEEMP